MKIFKYKFTKMITAFIGIGIALSVVAFGIDTYLVITQSVATAENPAILIIQYSLMYLVSVLLFVILTSLLISSYYSIDGKTFKTSFGIIKSRYDIKKIESVVLDRETKKLSVHFDENTFIVVVVKEEWYEEFISELLKANDKIEYTIKPKENTPDDKKGV